MKRRFAAWLVTGPLARALAFAIDFAAGLYYLATGKKPRDTVR